MRIEKVEAKNFMSFPTLEYSFPDSGFIFVGGEIADVSTNSSNGAGKSALFESLCWGLFGKTIRGAGAGEVVRWDSSEGGSVFVRFVTDSGKVCEVKRYRADKKHANSLFFFEDWKDITGGDSRVTQDEICKRLGMTWQVFSSAVIFGEKAQRFAEARDSEKKEIFDEILLLHRFQEAQRTVRDDLKSLRADRSKKQTEREYLERSLTAALSEIEEAEKGLENIHHQRRDVEIKTKALEKEREEIRRKIKEESSTRDALSSERDELSDSNDELLKMVLESEKKKAKKLADISRPIIEKRVELNQISGDIEKLKGKIRSLGSLRGKGSCPTCGQSLKKESVDGVAAHYKEEIKGLEKAYEDLEGVVLGLVEKEKESRLDLDREMAEITKLKAEVDHKVKSKALDLSTSINKINSLSVRLAALDRDFRGLVESLEEKELFWQAQYDRAAEKGLKLGEDLEKADQQIKESSDEERYLLFWDVAFGNSGVKSFLLDGVLPQLNDRVSYYISALLGDGTRVAFDTESQLKSGETRDKFGVKIFRDDKGIDYENLSAGEKRRVDVSILLALQSLVFERAAAGCNITVLDEVFDTLDRIGVEKVVNLLSEESERKAIYIISHISEFRDYFPKEIIIRKRDGKSEIVSGDSETERRES